MPGCFSLYMHTCIFIGRWKATWRWAYVLSAYTLCMHTYLRICLARIWGNPRNGFIDMCKISFVFTNDCVRACILSHVRTRAEDFPNLNFICGRFRLCVRVHAVCTAILIDTYISHMYYLILTYMRVCVCIYIYTCVCVHIHTHTNIKICIHTYNLQGD